MTTATPTEELEIEQLQKTLQERQAKLNSLLNDPDLDDYKKLLISRKELAEKVLAKILPQHREGDMHIGFDVGYNKALGEVLALIEGSGE